MKNELEKYKKKSTHLWDDYSRGSDSAAANNAQLKATAQEAEERVAPALEKYKAAEEDVAKKYDILDTNAKAEYDTAVRQQAASRSAAKRDAYIAHERLQKYLPQARAVQGVEGMGMTETAQVQGLNAYLANRSAADAAYASGVASLDAERQRAQAERDLARTAEESTARDTYLNERASILENYRKEKEAKAEEEAQAQSTAVGEMLAGMASEVYGEDGKMAQEGYDTLAAYLEANRNKLTDIDAKLADMMLEGYRRDVRSAEDQAAMDKGGLITVNASYSGISSFKDNKNLVVTANGREYRVQLNAPDDSSVSNAEVTAAAKKVGNGEVFGYGERLYIKHDGDVYAIEARDNSAKGEYSDLYDLFFGGKKTDDTSNQVQTLAAYASAYRPGNTVTVPDTYGQQQTVTIAREATAIENSGVKVSTLTPGVVYYVMGSKIVKGDDGKVYYVN